MAEEVAKELTVESRLTKVEVTTTNLVKDVNQLKNDYKLMQKMQQDIALQSKTLKTQGEALATISDTLNTIKNEMTQDKLERVIKDKEAAESKLKEKQENKQYWSRLCIGSLITTVIAIIALVIENVLNLV